MSPDPAKVEAIKKFKQPNNVQELRSFLGMVTYCGMFVKNFSTIAAPLRKLLHSHIKWQWEEEQEKAFKTI